MQHNYILEKSDNNGKPKRDADEISIYLLVWDADEISVYLLVSKRHLFSNHFIG